MFETHGIGDTPSSLERYLVYFTTDKIAKKFSTYVVLKYVPDQGVIFTVRAMLARY